MMKQIFLRFSQPLDPPLKRMDGDPQALSSSYSGTIPAFVYFQTSDADGFIHPWAKAEWLSETTCKVSIECQERLAIQASGKVEGFGSVMLRADNEGQLYDPGAWKDEEVVWFDREAARSEVFRCQQRLAGNPGNGEIGSLLNQAVDFLEKSHLAKDAESALKFANQALAAALHCSEAIEIGEAHSRLRALGKRPFSFGTFVDWNGSVFSPNRHSREFADLYKEIFNTAAVSIFWKDIQPESPEAFTWEKPDFQLSWMAEHGLMGIAHCLGWLQWTAAWLEQGPAGEVFRQRLLNMVRTAVARYGAQVDLWSVCNEYHDWFSAIPLSFDERVASFQAVAQLVQSMHPGPVESDSCLVTAPWKMSRPDWKIGPREWYQAVDRTQAKDYVIGLQFYHGGGEYATYDLGALARQLRFYTSLGHSLHLYVETPGGPGDAKTQQMPNNGSWHGAWSEETHADWWEAFLTLALSFPQVKGITTLALADTTPAWMNQGSFLRSNLSPKPAFERVKQVLARHTIPGPVAWR
jgi:endo-1,4-beta-xylanase